MMIAWTGGAPRALLFVAHSLQAMVHFDVSFLDQFKTLEKLKPLFGRLAEYYFGKEDLKIQLVGTMESLSQDERNVYDYFVYKAWMGDVVPNFLVYFFKEKEIVRMFSELGAAPSKGEYFDLIFCQAAVIHFRFEAMTSATPRPFRGLVPESFFDGIDEWSFSSLQLNSRKGPIVQGNGTAQVVDLVKWKRGRRLNPNWDLLCWETT
jgi:hypothetical protein